MFIGLREVTSERQVIPQDPSVTSMFSWSRMAIHLLYIIKQLLTDVSVDMNCY